MERKSSVKIFLVDDNHFCLNIYEQHLRNMGYNDLHCFDNGIDCINNLTELPDIIFLDHGMDIMNGVEVLKKIKRFSPDIFVVFISGQEDVQTAVDSLKYGAFDYIVKGTNDAGRIEQVLEKIQEVKIMLKDRNKGFFKKIKSII